ncbi:MAG: His-Xaa-Ser system radical SAM maturase HxsB [Deltaproteobacteria bacterium]|nr:His-Xaa-Ser system radical SAM maturase HxsB [Deltaproteobacteria bacterium]
MSVSFSDVIELDRVQPTFAMPFMHRVINGKILVTNDLGDYAFLELEEFTRFIQGELTPGEPLYERLAERNFIAEKVDVAAQARRFARKKGFLAYGPTLHAFVLTERCNHGCQYCHSSVVGMGRMDTDMPISTAEKAVDMAFQTTAPWFTIEFQGGEPTANWDTLSHVVKYGQEKNKLAGKELSFALVTNFSLMTDERLDFLIKNKVQICCSLDGPEDLHNKIRIYKSGNSYEITTGWIAKVNRRYEELGLDTSLYRVEALPTITKDSLHRYEEIVDTYIRHGCRAIFLRKLDPFGFAASTYKKLGYTMDDYIEFYRKAVDYILELNKQGVEVMERHAAIMLNKIMADEEPNYLDLRTPGGAVIGQVGYHPDGSVYSSDEGRFVAAMGDEIFKIGNVHEASYTDLFTQDTVKALLLASTNQSQPGCDSCTYKPYCGLQPEYNYKTQGSIQGRMADSTWCKKHKTIFDYLMEKLERADPEEMEIFRRWTTNRRQDHFVQE